MKKYTQEELDLLIEMLEVVYDLRLLEYYIAPLELVYIYTGKVPDWLPPWANAELKKIVPPPGGDLQKAIFDYYILFPSDFVGELKDLKKEYEPKEFWKIFKKSLEEGDSLFYEFLEILLKNLRKLVH